MKEIIQKRKKNKKVHGQHGTLRNTTASAHESIHLRATPPTSQSQPLTNQNRTYYLGVHLHPPTTNSVGQLFLFCSWPIRLFFAKESLKIAKKKKKPKTADFRKKHTREYT